MKNNLSKQIYYVNPIPEKIRNEKKNNSLRKAEKRREIGGIITKSDIKFQKKDVENS